MGETFYDILTPKDTVRAHFGFPTFKTTSDFTLLNDDYDEQLFACGLQANLEDSKINTISSKDLVLQIERICSRVGRIRDNLNLNIKILILIRRQSSIILSKYGQGIRTNHWVGLPLEDILTWDSVKFNEQRISLLCYDYLATFEVCSKYFGDKNVLILPFESLFKQGIESLQKISVFAGVKQENSFLRLILDRPPVNITEDRMKQHIDWLNPKKDKLLSEIDARFTDSNRKLDQTLKIGLKELGYY